MPHLRRGAMRDFKDIMQSHNYWVDDRWNKTDSIYTFETNSNMEFFSLDMPRKVRGPRRQRLFINEANNIPYETFDQLEIRTEDEVWCDWNPVAEFWWHEITSKRDDAEKIILTYKDNEGLPESIVKSIESHKDNKNWWTVYGLGQTGEIEGRIYTGWGVVDNIPENAKFKNFGLDFGYTNDPTAIVATYKLNDTIILDEICYRKGMLNGDIYQVMKDKEGLIIADSASPKDIAELNLLGLTVQAAIKGKDSIKYGIGVVQSKKILVTKRSINLLKEYRNYLWEKDANDKNVNVPQDFDNHCFVGSTTINTYGGNKKIKDVVVGDMVLTRSGYKKVVYKWNNGYKPVNKYLLHLDTGEDIILTCTPNHKIKTRNGWKEISILKSGEMVYLAKYLTKKNITCIQTRNTFQKLIQECTLKYGRSITEKLKMDFISTTKMEIHGIIGLKILNVLKIINTYLNTVKKDFLRIKNGRLNFNKRGLLWQRSGIRLGKELPGILNMVKIHGRKLNIERLIALFVEKNIKPDTGEYQNIVIKTAKLKHLECVEGNREIVYDLTVDGSHEYFANGILVHNCLDALRYSLTKLYNDEIPIIPKPPQFSGQAILDQLLEGEDDLYNR